MKLNSVKIVFFSSCFDEWGGSEELWSQTAGKFAEQGYEIYIFKLNINFSTPQIKKLSKLGCRFTDLEKCLPALPQRVLARLLPHHPQRNQPFYIKKFLARRMREIKPDLIVISQGDNFDGLPFVRYCPLEEFPYVVISQKASDFIWVSDWDREWMKKIWQQSAGNYFVSEHNLRATESQFAMQFPNAEVVRNPFLTKCEKPLDWNFTENERLHLACVGRLFPWDKGQDILLKVLARNKWRERNVEVSLFGKGVATLGLKELADYLKLENVVFKGHISDINSIWSNHQALILPSRNEGLPLVLVEAMFCGRTAIVTDVGGNREVLEDNVTGFIAESINEDGIDNALERAWQRRSELKEIGYLAAERIRTLIPPDPAQVFADKLLKII